MDERVRVNVCFRESGTNVTSAEEEEKEGQRRKRRMSARAWKRYRRRASRNLSGSMEGGGRPTG
jgi:hypothetical protein